eukprot:11996290-Alexandrium_andersonii.AAC.1
MPPRRFCLRHPAIYWFRLADLRYEPRFDSQTLPSRILSPRTSSVSTCPRLSLQTAPRTSPNQRRSFWPL